jgi:hypothetical protein
VVCRYCIQWILTLGGCSWRWGYSVRKTLFKPGDVVLGDNLGMQYERDGTCDVRKDMIYTWAFYVGSTEVVSVVDTQVVSL